MGWCSCLLLVTERQGDTRWCPSGWPGVTHIPLCPCHINTSLCSLDYQGQYLCQYNDFFLLLLILGHEFKAHVAATNYSSVGHLLCPLPRMGPFGRPGPSTRQNPELRDRKLTIPSGSSEVMASGAMHCCFYPLVSKLRYLSYWRQYHAGVSDLINILHPKGYTPFFSEGFL